MESNVIPIKPDKSAFYRAIDTLGGKANNIPRYAVPFVFLEDDKYNHEKLNNLKIADNNPMFEKLFSLAVKELERVTKNPTGKTLKERLKHLSKQDAEKLSELFINIKSPYQLYLKLKENEIKPESFVINGDFMFIEVGMRCYSMHGSCLIINKGSSNAAFLPRYSRKGGLQK